MRKARVFVHDIEAGILEERENNQYCFTYHTEYGGPPVSLIMPIKNKIYAFNRFPSFFEGLLPEGTMLEALLRTHKLDKKDYFGQLLIIGCQLAWNFDPLLAFKIDPSLLGKNG